MDPPTPDQALAGALRLAQPGAKRRLVLLHGWGADADDLFELGPLLVGRDVDVVALQAPWPHPAGQGRQWYDLQHANWPDLPQARTDLIQRLKDLGHELTLSQTIVLGFSQGAAMALDVATGGQGLGLAGLIGCSGYPHPDWKPETLLKTTVLLTHGKQDPVVPYGASEALCDQLQAAGHAVKLLGFSGGHTIEESLFPALRTFIDQQWH